MRQQLKGITPWVFIVIMVSCIAFSIIKSENQSLVAFALFGMPLLYLFLYTMFEERMEKGNLVFLTLTMYFIAITMLVAF
jgi:hypothetical protein